MPIILKKRNVPPEPVLQPPSLAVAADNFKGSNPDGSNPLCQDHKKGKACPWAYKCYSCAACNFIWDTERQR